MALVDALASTASTSTARNGAALRKNNSFRNANASTSTAVAGGSYLQSGMRSQKGGMAHHGGDNAKQHTSDRLRTHAVVVLDEDGNDVTPQPLIHSSMKPQSPAKTSESVGRDRQASTSMDGNSQKMSSRVSVPFGVRFDETEQVGRRF
jgi:hypothetical protein